MFKTIIVAVDGSDHAREALKAAAELARIGEGSLRLITIPQPAVDPVLVGYTTVPIPVSHEELEKDGRVVLDKALAEVPAPLAGRVTSKVLFGDPAHAIVDEAVASKADLIVLGRRGLGRLAGLLIGSTTTKVSQLAPCAVLTVK